MWLPRARGRVTGAPAREISRSEKAEADGKAVARGREKAGWQAAGWKGKNVKGMGREKSVMWCTGMSRHEK